jgi:hypothetical protein
MAENAPPPAPPKADPPPPPPSPPLLTLVVKNQSTVPGIQYFNVFPPPLDISPLPPPQELTVVPTVSDATNNSTQPKAVLKWPAPPTLSLIALKRGDGMGAATPTPVTLGSTVAINWKDGAFAIVATPGTGDTIKLAFDPAIPTGSRVGLFVGPGPTFMPIGGEGLTLTPSMTPNYTVQFGTPAGGPVDFKDLSALAPVSFMGNTALIVVGSDNVIVQRDDELEPDD